jgi:hypothetical protein
MTDGWIETGEETTQERWSRDLEHGEVRPAEEPDPNESSVR